MKKTTFWILLVIEFLCGWVTTDILFRGWVCSLLLVGGNYVFVKLCYKKFVEWFEPPEADASAVPNAVLAVTAAELVLFQALNIMLFYAI